jgi:hypothetical protein
MTTPNLAIPHIAASQNQKEVTANDAFDRLDEAITGRLQLDFASGDVTLSASQLRRHVAFAAANVTPGRELVAWVLLARPAGVPGDAPAPARVIVQPGSAHLEFLDLPLLTGEELPHAPHVAALRRPWTGPVAVYMANDDYGYRLNTVLRRPAVMGRLVDPLPASVPGVLARGPLQVRLDWGGVASQHARDDAGQPRAG